MASDKSDRILNHLHKDFFVIGKARVHASVSWFIIGAFTGLAVSLVILANRSFQFDQSLAQQPGAVAGTSFATTNFVPGEIVIGFRDNVSDAQAAAFLKSKKLSVKSEIREIKVKVIQVPEEAEEKLAIALAHNPIVEFAEVNRINQLALIPNDPEYSSEWHHTAIHSAEAWNAGTGQNTLLADGDTGVDTDHPDLASHLRLDLSKSFIGTGSAEDVHGHGTMTTGAMAAIGDNANQVAGVAYNASVIEYQVANSQGASSDSAIAAAITEAAKQKVKVINFSISQLCGASAVLKAAGSLKNAGGLTFFAGGNSNVLQSCSPSSNAIFVSATEPGDARAGFSDYGNFIDLAAPGVGICTTTNGGGTGCGSGTSFASPVAAGVAALVWSINPALSPAQVEKVLFDTATDAGSSGFDQYFGWGRVDAGAAAALALSQKGTGSIDTAPPTVSITAPATGATVTGVVSVDVMAVDAGGVSRVELYKNGSLFATDSISPYSFAWNTLNDANGTYALQARAYDAAGNSASANAEVMVANVPDDSVPTVTITAPQDGATITTGTFSINASATDNVAVYAIDIFFDGSLQQTCIRMSSCSVSVNLRKAYDGPHTILATSRDARGNTASQTITVTKISSSGGSSKPRR
jgi:thermitase